MVWTVITEGERRWKNEFFRASIFLAHQIRTSEILPWDRKSYLTHVILPRLSREGSQCTLVVLELACMVVKWHHCYVKVTSSCHAASQRIQELLGAFFKHKMRYLMVSKKKDPLFVWEWDRKISPSRSLFGITRQAS